MKSSTLLTFTLFLLITFFSCQQATESKELVTKTVEDANGYSYDYVENDPSKTRVYTLENGLKVYLSVYKEEPRI